MSNKRSWSFPMGTDGVQKFVFDRELRNCHALGAKSWRDELVELDKGLWVILWVFPWSATSASSLPVAIETISKMDRNVQIGIRCGDGDWHLHLWCPLAQAEVSDPVWLFSRDGEIMEQKVGYMGEQQIIEMIDKLLPNS